VQESHLLLPVHPRCRPLFLVAGADASAQKVVCSDPVVGPKKIVWGFFKEMVLHPKEIAQIYYFSLRLIIPILDFQKKRKTQRERFEEKEADLQHCFHAFFSLSGTTYCTACLRILDSVVPADISCTKMYSR